MAIKFLNTVAVDTDVLYVDAANDRVGIGTTSPEARLSVSDDGQAVFEILPFTNDYGTTLRSYDTVDETFNYLSYKANTHRFNIGDAEKMRINSSGNVGIGTTNPGAKLEVYGATPNILINNTAETDSGIVFTDAQAGTSQRAAIKFNSGDNKLKFFVNDEVAQRMVIDTAGNVGIGTANPAEKLHVFGGSAAIEIDSTTNEAALKYDNSTTTATIKLANNDLKTELGGSEVMRILATGNVGIGTTSPGAKLDVAGVIRNVYQVDPGAGGAVIGKMLAYNPSPFGIISKAYSSGAVSLQSQREGNDAQLYTLAFQPLGGNVGIGTTSPSGKLDVAGDIRLQSDNQIYFGATGAIPYWTAGIDNTTNNNFVIGGVSYYSGDRDILLTPVNNGNVGISTTAPSQKLHVAGNMRLQNQFYDSTNSQGTNGEVLTKVSAGTEWKAPAVNAQMLDNTAAASAANVGTIRYRSTSSTSFVDMSMQTGATTYTWVNIVSNFW